MTAIYFGTAAFLLLNLIVGWVRVYIGPTRADRLIGTLIFGTTTVAILLLLAKATEEAALVDVALLFVLLAAIIVVAFTGEKAPSQGSGE